MWWQALGKRSSGSYISITMAPVTWLQPMKPSARACVGMQETGKYTTARA